jgi:ribosomal protein L4
MEVKGKVKRIGIEEVISEKFKKRTIVLETGDKFPQVVELQAAQDKCDLLNDLEIDQDVTVHFNLRGREWTNKEGVIKVFNTLDLWKVEKAEPF